MCIYIYKWTRWNLHLCICVYTIYICVSTTCICVSNISIVFTLWVDTHKYIVDTHIYMADTHVYVYVYIWWIYIYFYVYTPYPHIHMYIWVDIGYIHIHIYAYAPCPNIHKVCVQTHTFREAVPGHCTCMLQLCGTCQIGYIIINSTYTKYVIYSLLLYIIYMCIYYIHTYLSRSCAGASHVHAAALRHVSHCNKTTSTGACTFICVT